jgi:CheY-like chemotaxis protein
MTNGLRAIIFDDDALVRGVVSQICRRRGYDVVEFEDGNSFCENIPDCPCDNKKRCADVLISDIKMPGVTGVQLLDKLFKRQCAVPYMGLMSGYWTPETLEYATEKGFRVFRKPVGIWEIDKWLIECEEGLSAENRKLVNCYDEAEEQFSECMR